MKTKLQSEEGTNPASVVIVVLIILLILELVVVGGRLAAAQGNVSNAAREAARQGTLVQSRHQLDAAVDEVGHNNLNAGNRPQCTALDVRAVSAAYSYHDFRPGGKVTVEVFCTVDLSDMSAFGLPLPDVRVESRHTEIIETYRAVGDL